MTPKEAGLEKNLNSKAMLTLNSYSCENSHDLRAILKQESHY